MVLDPRLVVIDLVVLVVRDGEAFVETYSSYLTSLMSPEMTSRSQLARSEVVTGDICSSRKHVSQVA